MTVYESVQSWLTEIINELKAEFNHPYVAIDLEKIPLPTDYPGIDFQAGGIFSSPNDFTTMNNGGQLKNTSFKSFYLRRPFKEFSSRLETKAFLKSWQRKSMSGIWTIICQKMAGTGNQFL
jgi:hypothetical protein